MFEVWRWRPYALRSLATVAATVLLVVGIRAYLSGPLEWMRPEISLGVQYRGGEPERPQPYSREELLEIAWRPSPVGRKILCRHESAEHPRSGRGWGRKWRLAAKYQELPGGGTQVQVTLYSSRHGTSLKEWNSYYPNLRSFENDVDELREQIVKELIANEPEKP